MHGVRGCSNFWPGEFHGLCSPWGCKESDTTERLSLHIPSWYLYELVLVSAVQKSESALYIHISPLLM